MFHFVISTLSRVQTKQIKLFDEEFLVLTDEPDRKTLNYSPFSLYLNKITCLCNWQSMNN